MNPPARHVRSVLASPAAWACAAALAALGLGVLGAACVIADPPPEVPVPPPHRPTIVHGSVVPPPTAIITSFPTTLTFDVPVELIDPSQGFQYALFYDYPVNITPAVAETVAPDPAFTDAGVRIVEVQPSPPQDPTSCHVIEFIVAAHFTGGSSHTPDSTGGDSVVWFYNPSGNPGGCPQYDAGGLDGAFPTQDAPGEAASDAPVAP